jgi:hypothetical protein
MGSARFTDGNDDKRFFASHRDQSRNLETLPFLLQKKVKGLAANKLIAFQSILSQDM